MEAGGAINTGDVLQSERWGSERPHAAFRHALFAFAERTHGLFRTGLTTRSIERSLQLALDARLLPVALRVKEGRLQQDTDEDVRSCTYDPVSAAIVMTPGSLALLAGAATGSEQGPELQTAVRTLVRELVRCAAEAVQRAGMHGRAEDGEPSADALRAALAETVARNRERECAAYLGVSHFMQQQVDGQGLAEDRALGICMGMVDALGRLSGMAGEERARDAVVTALLDAGALPQTLPEVAARLFASTGMSAGMLQPTEALRVRCADEIAAGVQMDLLSGQGALDQDAFHRGQVIAAHLREGIHEEELSRRATRTSEKNVGEAGLQGTPLGMRYSRQVPSGTAYRSMV